MTALLLPMPFLTALDSAGRPIANARLYLYESDSTTNAAAYTTAGLNTPHDQPIVADAAGRFPAIYLRPILYRAVLKDTAGTVLAEADPINPQAGLISSEDIADSAITAAKLSATAISAKLGYTPLGPSGGTLTGDLILSTSAPAALVDGLAGFRGVPFTLMNDDHPVGAGDVGKGLLHTSDDPHTYTILPDGAGAGQAPWGSGSGFVVYNDGTAAVTVARPEGGPPDIRKAGSLSDANVVIAQGGFASFFRVKANTWVCSGAGIT